VDQWLVVDSGSTDGTQEKLRELVGDKLLLIQDDMVRTKGYAYARTKLIELNKGMDWILIVDGDERMWLEDVKKLKNIVDSNPDYDMIWLPRVHYEGDLEKGWVRRGKGDGTNALGPDWKAAIRVLADWQPRLIKRTMINGQSKVQYKYVVHEIIYKSETLNMLKDLNSPVIRHYRFYKSPERLKMIHEVCMHLRELHPNDFAIKG